jgi:hypothetical protein
MYFILKYIGVLRILNTALLIFICISMIFTYTFLLELRKKSPKVRGLIVRRRIYRKMILLDYRYFLLP